jgi:hypothetical protein
MRFREDARDNKMIIVYHTSKSVNKDFGKDNANEAGRDGSGNSCGHHDCGGIGKDDSADGDGDSDASCGYGVNNDRYRRNGFLSNIINIA